MASLTKWFLVFFIPFEWGKIVESLVNKQEAKRTPKLYLNKYFVTVNVLVAVFCRNFSVTNNFNQSCFEKIGKLFAKILAKHGHNYTDVSGKLNAA